MLDPLLIRYSDRNRPDLGLIKGEFYDQIPSGCKAAVKVRTSTGLEIYCPTDWFRTEDDKKKRLETGKSFERTGRFEFRTLTGHLADNRYFKEIFLPYLHITIIKKLTKKCRSPKTPPPLPTTI